MFTNVLLPDAMASPPISTFRICRDAAKLGCQTKTNLLKEHIFNYYKTYANVISHCKYQ